MMKAIAWPHMIKFRPDKKTKKKKKKFMLCERPELRPRSNIGYFVLIKIISIHDAKIYI